MVDLRGVPLPVSTVRVGDPLVNRRTYTLACGPVFGAKVNCSVKEMNILSQGL